jgi:hypothetical protein
MTFTTLIALNAALDLAVVLAVFAIVYFTHRRRHDAVKPETILPSEIVPSRLRLPADEASELAEAA